MDIVTHVIAHYSIAGIIVLAMVSNVFPGLPEEAFLLVLGYIGGTTGFGTLNFAEIAFLIMVGLLISDSILYWLAYKGNKIIDRVGNKLLGRIIKDELTLKRHLGKIIFISRFVMQFRFVGPFLAGSKKFPYQKFLLVDIAALAIYIPMVLGIGSYFQNRIERILSGVGVVQNIFFIFLILVIGFVFWSSIKKQLYKMVAFANNEKLRQFLGFSKVDKDEH